LLLCTSPPSPFSMGEPDAYIECKGRGVRRNFAVVQRGPKSR
jgi:hypothetical protein